MTGGIHRRDAEDAEAAVRSDWAIQPEEKAIIPASETRDYSHWKKVADVSG